MEIEAVLSPEKIKSEFRISYGSVASETHPNRNEDAVCVNEKKLIFGLFDGVGGIENGEIASKNGVNQLDMNSQKIFYNMSEDNAESFLRTTFNGINKRNFEEVVFSTGVAGVVCGEAKNKRMVIANVGDSRAYRYRDNYLYQITIDDNSISEFLGYNLKTREVQSRLNNAVNPDKDLTKEEYLYFNNRNVITASLGHKELSTRIYSVSLKKGDKILFCSDGVSDNLTDNEIRDILKDTTNNEASVLIEKAKTLSQGNHPRSKKDDMSAIVVNF